MDTKDLNELTCRSIENGKGVGAEILKKCKEVAEKGYFFYVHTCFTHADIDPKVIQFIESKGYKVTKEKGDAYDNDGDRYIVFNYKIQW